jgi:hypothetical protein
MPSIITKTTGTTDNNGRQSSGKKREYIKFSDRIEHLMAYKAQHGHVNVREKEDSGLYEFCKNMRKARRGNKGGAKITMARLTALDALGFDWKLPPGVVVGQINGGTNAEQGGGLTEEEQIKKWIQLAEDLPGADLTQTTHTLLPLGEDGTNGGGHVSGGGKGK